MLPTPRANQVNGCDLNNPKIANRNKGNLEEVVSKIIVGMLPTPIARDEKGGVSKVTKRIQRKLDQGRGIELNELASMGLLPTPAAADFNPRGDQPNWKGDDLSSTIHKTTNQPGKTSQLNPQFVEEMMGFPVNWTVSPFQSGGTKV